MKARKTLTFRAMTAQTNKDFWIKEQTLITRKMNDNQGKFMKFIIFTLFLIQINSAMAETKVTCKEIDSVLKILISDLIHVEQSSQQICLQQPAHGAVCTPLNTKQNQQAIQFARSKVQQYCNSVEQQLGQQPQP